MPAQPDILFGIMAFLILVVSCGLACALLTAFLLHDKKKGYVWLAIVILSALYTLIRLFPEHPGLGSMALVVYTVFSLLSYVTIKGKRND